MSNSFDQIMRRITSQLDSIQRDKEEKGKRTSADIGTIRNEHTKEQHDAEAFHDAKVNATDDRASKAVIGLNQWNDSFEVSKGRIAPDLFNMRYGGGAAAGGSAGSATGTGKPIPGKITEADLLKTYSVRAKSPDDPWGDFNGKMPDFETYKDTMAGIGGGQPQMSGQDFFRNEASKTMAYEKENTRPIVASTLKGGTLKFTENSMEPYALPSAPVPQTVQPVVASARDLVNRSGAGMGSRQVPYPGQRPEPVSGGYDSAEGALMSLGGVRTNGRVNKPSTFNMERFTIPGGMASAETAFMNTPRPERVFERGPMRTGAALTDIQKRDDFGRIETRQPRYVPPGATPGVMGSGKPTTSYLDLTKRFSVEADKKRKSRIKAINFSSMGGQQF